MMPKCAKSTSPTLPVSNIGYDNYYSTHSPENKQFSQDIYRALKANGKIESRVIEQLFDPKKQMFLPDRFVKGECPKCHAQDPIRRQLRSLRHDLFPDRTD